VKAPGAQQKQFGPRAAAQVPAGRDLHRSRAGNQRADPRARRQAKRLAGGRPRCLGQRESGHGQGFRAVPTLSLLSEAARRAGGGVAPGFFTLTPCRLLDTRTQPGGPIAAGAVREVAVSGCSVPSTATSVAINVTALGSTSRGDVAVYAVDPPTVANSIVSFGLGAVRANNAIAPISATGTLKIKPTLSTLATPHVVVDVVGYFQ